MRRDPGVSRYEASRLSPQRRAADLARMRDETFDVLIIGGGVTGAGTALDAASRGLSVALVEARDWASGTSSRSSKLIHGGLRYLEQFEFGLVHEALRERGLLLTRLAPHLVRPVPFLVPLTKWYERPYFGSGVLLYDVMGSAVGGVKGGERGVPWHRHLTRRGAKRLFPSLGDDVLRGAIRYYDGQVDDARYTMTLARSAASYGAALATSTRVTGIIRDARQVVGVTVRDMETRESFDVRARTVIAATGVWSDDISEMIHESAGMRVRASKGIHLLVPRSAISGDVGLILRTEKSVLFVIPWGGHWIIGTTDTDWDLDRAHPAASETDINYILEHVNRVLDRPLSVADIEGVYAGLRPLLAGEDESTSKLSREHAVVEPLLGLMLVAGGKYTTYRVMARDVVDQAAHRLSSLRVAGQPPGERHGDSTWTPRSRTSQVPLAGADGFRAAWANRSGLARRHGVPVGVVEHLLERYGALATELLRLVDERPELGHAVPGAPEYLAAEVYYAAAAEGALHLDDVLTRRTRISIETVHRGVDTARAAADLMGDVLGWDDVTRKREVDHYLARVAAERESQRMADDRTADAARLGAPDVRGYGADHTTHASPTHRRR